MLANETNDELIDSEDNDSFFVREEVSNICKNIMSLKSLYGKIYRKLFRYLLTSAAIKETIDKLTDGKDNIFIVGHNRLDLDALVSCLGFSLICNKKNIKSYIVTDDEIDKMEKVTRSVIYDVKDNYNIIKSSDLDNLLTDNSLLVVLDTNKYNLVCVRNYLDRFKDIFILDHHNTDDKTINTEYIFALDNLLSSTCEEISILLDLYNIKIDSKFATYLYAGIILDTNRFRYNVSQLTHLVACNLTVNGADSNKANNMFLEDFETNRYTQKLADTAEFIIDEDNSCSYAIAVQDENCKKIYGIDEVAKASNCLLNLCYKDYNVDASFVVSYTSEDVISISARSKELIDVSKIMSNFENSGGNKHSAAARIKNMTLEEIQNKLREILKEQINNKELVLTKSKM